MAVARPVIELPTLSELHPEDRTAIDRLIHRLSEDTVDVLPMALGSLALERDPRVLHLASTLVRRYADVVVELLRSERAGTRALAATGMSHVQLEDAYPRLLELLDDEDAQVRGAALSGVLAYRRNGALKHVMRALEDPVVTVRQDAADLLYRFSKLPKKRLRALLRDETDDKVRQRLEDLVGPAPTSASRT